MLNALYTVVIYPLTQIIEFVFVFSQKVFKETGWSVAAVSAAISVLCLPLYAVAERWQQTERDAQKRLKPKVDKIRAVFAGDERYMILSAYYRQNRYHPAYALRGAFGLLIQVPFFIAAYSYLSHLEALKGARFLFIRDMGAPDSLLHVGRFALNVLPVAMTLINVAASAVYAKGFPAKEKAQLYGTALVFLALLYNSPAGLVLYWTLNNVFSLAKNAYYALKSKHKDRVISAAISGLCAFIVYYLLAVHTGNIDVRLAASAVFGVIAAIPWVAPAAQKALAALPDAGRIKRGVFPLFACTCAACWALIGLVTPSMLIASSPQEFSFIDAYASPLHFGTAAALQSFGFLVFWPCCLYALFSPSVKERGAVAYFVLFSGALCNVFAFPGRYGLISVTLEFTDGVSHSNKEMLVNLFVLCVLSAVSLTLFRKNGRRVLTAVSALCFCSFLGISLLNWAKITSAYTELAKFYAPEERKLQTVEPIFHLSKTGKNVVVIMLDRAVSVFMPFIFEESPELAEAYSGFVFYPNTVSFNGYTGIGSPPIFGGYEATPKEINKRTGVPLKRKHNEALMMMPRLFSEAGYAVTATDSPYANYSDRPDMRIYEELPGVKTYITDSAYTDIWLKEHDFALPLTSDILRRGILWYSVFRSVPYVFREGIYMKGDWCAPVANRSLKLTLNGYSVLDYLPKLTDADSPAENTALFMANNTTHEGSLLQAPDYVPVTAVTNYGTSTFKKETAYHINASAIKRLAAWFQYLKDEGVYDNTRIILVSDHGPEPNFVTKIGLPFNVDQFNPLLMAKDFDAVGSLQTDRVFMTNADVPVLALRGLFADPINPYTGNKITDENKKKPLYIAISGSIHLSDPNVTQFGLNPKEDYYIHDNIFDPANWEQVEK
ncbi:YidC/Oxa1 family membrane protein insertase [Treponema endosymbiont of Eucomonympha sp.]|uniref:YidC/Oxa1 family membrane protein insertase n=1 Tax=Treponema endosymbiont of Eucomonympha sp. TaxID=1580831 RepID=UPI00075077C8|nr:YidC/Oxa1 family membrane protein insertase [Treponema endosymbiont of Eucomonympha sp.]